jgi:hypothetical protein
VAATRPSAPAFDTTGNGVGPGIVKTSIFPARAPHEKVRTISKARPHPRSAFGGLKFFFHPPGPGRLRRLAKGTLWCVLKRSEKRADAKR